MKKQGGFTLIELVVVIVILGILAITAAPRFLNLQSDARESSLQGLKGAMASAGSIVYGKASIEGVERKPKGSDAKLADGTLLAFGYPSVDEKGLKTVVQGLEDGDEWNTTTSGSTSLLVGFATPTGDVNANQECYVIYTEAANSASTPTIEVKSDDC